ncbi:SLC13 family permease [Methylobacterium sp. J-077]|uniref:SLC13 family permease n=1 Tax=Methylobacterium sp. J-077 TaxID=2836656 RepID=UPI001FB91DF5|nr:SLC13 family permease [Methylobacterium sp. J-077]MCJ2121789.1 anion permease [Methylobacterium sp. J-077]
MLDGLDSGGLLLPALLTAVTITLWATARLPEYLIALLFFAAAMVLRVAPGETVFSGFLSSAFWLVLSGFVLGVAIRKVGLADRVARLLAARLSGSWPRLVGGVVLLTYALAFVMPSNMGRITLLMPIVMALADRVGLADDRRSRSGLALAVGFGTFQLSASILTANVPNLVMAGAAETAYGIHLSYLPYLALHAPVLGLVKGVALTACICLLFPGRPRAVAPSEPATPPSAAEWRLGVLLLATLALWLTEAWHGIAPAWVGLAAACLCLLPRVGFLNGEEFATGVNVRTCLYVAGILGLAAVVAQSGLGAMLGRAILAVAPLDPGASFRDFATLTGVTALLNFVVTANGVPALFTPLAGTLADVTGLPLATVLMAQVVGYATPILPYQASPIVVAMGMGGVPARDGIWLSVALATITFLVLVPLDWAWFRLLGWIV